MSFRAQVIAVHTIHRCVKPGQAKTETSPARKPVMEEVKPGTRFTITDPAEYKDLHGSGAVVNADDPASLSPAVKEAAPTPVVPAADTNQMADQGNANGDQDQSGDTPKTAAEILAMIDDKEVQYATARAEAVKLLGKDNTPAKKDELIAALKAHKSDDEADLI